MILILAATADLTAHEVCRWLRRSGHEVLRIDSDDPVVELEVELDAEHEDARVVTRTGRSFRLSQVRAYWYRRGALALDPAQLGGDTESEAARARAHEWLALREWLMSALAAKPSLGSWQAEDRCTKLTALSHARALGLAIPATRISGSRPRLLAAIEDWRGAIHKGIQSGAPREEDPACGWGTTRRVDRAQLAEMPARAFPRLVQPLLDKQLELRICFVTEHWWPMAMIPRRPGAAPVDARLGDVDAAYHFVPYRLPTAVETKLRALMQRLELDTGSIDMIVGPDGTHTFLEVNPAGQLDALARACNAPIERVIAEHLAALAGPNEQEPAPTCGGWLSEAAPELGSASTAARAPEPEDFAEAELRFAWSRGQRVLVRGLGKPIMRNYVAPQPTSARSHDTKSTPRPAPAPPGPSQASEAGGNGRHPTLLPCLPTSLRLVEGRTRTLLYDLQRGKALAVPPALREFLLACADPDTELELDRVDPQLLATAERAGVLARVGDPTRLADKPLAWEHPAAITNTILDVDASSRHDFPAIFAQLEDLGCEHLLIRVAREGALELLDEVHAALADGPVLFVEWWLRGAAELTREALIERVRRWPRILAVAVFDQPEAGQWLRTRSGVGNILAVREALSLSQAPTPELAGMFVGDALFRESQAHNAFFHRKLAIDARGWIRNAPHLAPSFGRVGERPLAQVVASEAFTMLGRLHKGLIAGCRECELRHACLDARVPEPAPDASAGYRHRSACPYEPASLAKACT